jgi:dUTPase
MDYLVELLRKVLREGVVSEDLRDEIIQAVYNYDEERFLIKDVKYGG